MKNREDKNDVNVILLESVPQFYYMKKEKEHE